MTLNTISPTTRLEPAKMIVCMLPDDGTDIKIMHQLRKEKDLTRAESIACRGVHNLQATKTRLGKLPEPTLYRTLTIIVTDAEADDVFDFIYEKAQIGQPGRGAMVQTTLLCATRHVMPDDVPEEEYKT
jgi:nitrogen regulatory protein PII